MAENCGAGQRQALSDHACARAQGEQAAAAGEGKAQGTGFGPVFSCMAAEADASRNDGSIHAAAKCGAEAQLARLLDDGAPVDLVGTTAHRPPLSYVEVHKHWGMIPSDATIITRATVNSRILQRHVRLISR